MSHTPGSSISLVFQLGGFFFYVYEERINNTSQITTKICISVQSQCYNTQTIISETAFYGSLTLRRDMRFKLPRRIPTYLPTHSPYPPTYVEQSPHNLIFLKLVDKFPALSWSPYLSPCSQEPNTRLCPRLNESTSSPPILSLRASLIFFHLGLGFPSPK